MSSVMSSVSPTGSGAVAHLQCLHCGHFSKGHAHLLSHLANDHPTSLDDMPVGRLGNILMYQPEPRLFHCEPCFFTSRDFAKVFQHIIAKHCDDGAGKEEEEGGGERPTVKEEEPEPLNEEEEGGGERPTAKEEEPEPLNEEEEGGGERPTAKEEEPEPLNEEEEEEEEEVEEVEPKVEKPKDNDGSYGCKMKGLDIRPVIQQQDVARSYDSDVASASSKETPPTLESSSPLNIHEKSDSLSSGVEKTDSSSMSDDIKDPTVDHNENDNIGKSNQSFNSDTKNFLAFNGTLYRCLICGWKNKVKAFGVNHVIRNHDVPRMYASHGVQGDTVTPDDEDVVGLSAEMLKEEIEATAKVVSFAASRFFCLICGWKTKLKGFAISHVIRFHNVELPYSCKDCGRRFFLPSRLHQHVRVEHRPGRYFCPFCCFRTHVLGGFKRHCSRCCAREGAEPGQGPEPAHGVESGQWVEPAERRAGRKRRRTVKMMEAEDEEDKD